MWHDIKGFWNANRHSLPFTFNEIHAQIHSRKDMIWNTISVLRYILERKKSIFSHPIIVRVWFWPCNSKTGYHWPSNYQNRSHLAIRLFCRAVLLTWTPRGGKPHLSALPPLLYAGHQFWVGFPRIHIQSHSRNLHGPILLYLKAAPTSSGPNMGRCLNPIMSFRSDILSRTFKFKNCLGPLSSNIV